MGALLNADLRRVASRRSVQGWLCAGTLLILFSVSMSWALGPINQPAQVWLENLSQTALVVAVVTLLLGATATGADWRHGCFPLMATWEPRRHRLVIMRIATSAAGGLVIGWLLLGIMAGTSYLVLFHIKEPDLSQLVTGHFADEPAALKDLNPQQLQEYLRLSRTIDWDRTTHVALAGGLIAGWSAAVGAALAMVVRNSTGAIAIAGLYIGVVETVIRRYTQSGQLLQRYLMVLLDLPYKVRVDFVPPGSGWTMTLLPDPPIYVSGGIMLAILVGLVIASATTIRLRDLV